MSSKEVSYTRVLSYILGIIISLTLRKVKLCFQHCDTSELELRIDERLMLSD